MGLISADNKSSNIFVHIDRLHEQEIPFSRIAHLHVFISDMSKFSDMNSVYGSFFGSSPPSRTCVSVVLPTGINIMVDCIAYDESTSSPRISLHVQSLSYWAPANIGPYSQAIIVSTYVNEHDAFSE